MQEEDGRYKCENCSKMYDSCKATYMINAKISDFTESLYVNFAREQGEAIIGMPAEVFKSKAENWTQEETQEFFDTLTFKQYKVVLRARMESYMGEQRTRYFAIKVIPRTGPAGLMILQNENKSLIDRLNIYKNMPMKDSRGNNDMMNDDQMDDS